MTNRAVDRDTFIDRESEQQLFQELLALRGDARLLAIRADGGMGKSRLLEQFHYRCRTARPRIPVCLVALDQLSDASPLALIREVVRQLTMLGADFSLFAKNETARIAGDFLTIRAFLDFDKASFRDAKDIHIRGINVERAEQVTIRGESIRLTDEQETVAQEASITAFFTDLARYCGDHPAVIMLDAYERCTIALQHWIRDHFLEQVCFNRKERPQQLIVVLAGRELPAFDHHWSDEECQTILRLVPQMSIWERHHLEQCLQMHGFADTGETIDRLYWFVQRGVPPSQVVQIVQAMVLEQRGRG